MKTKHGRFHRMVQFLVSMKGGIQHRLKGWAALQVLSICALIVPDMTADKLVELCLDIAGKTES